MQNTQPLGSMVSHHPGHNDWLTDQQLRALTPEILVSRMADLRDLVATNARRAEELRRPVDEVWGAIRRTGALYHFVPKRFGGLEFDLNTLIDMILPIAEGCTSTGWVTAFCMEHNYLLANFPLDTQEEIFGEFPYITAPGTLYPPGAATPVNGGFKLSGRWKWASGVMHADWAMLGGIVANGGLQPDLRFFLVPIEDVSVIDTWHMDGMAGTGSNDVEVRDLYVPERRTLSMLDLRSGRAWGPKIHDGWLFKVSMPLLSAFTAAIPSLGAARRAVQDFEDRLSSGDQKRTERAASHMRLGAARLEVMTAEAIMRDIARKAESMARKGLIPELNQRVEERARVCHALELSRTAVRRISEIAGSTAHSLDNPIQRAFRDINVCTSHAVFEWDAVTEAYGRTRVGLPPNTLLDGQ